MFIRSNYERKTTHERIKGKDTHNINIDMGNEGIDLTDFRNDRKSFIKNLVTPVLKSFSKRKTFFRNLSLVLRITFLNTDTEQESIFSYSYPQKNLSRTNIEKWFNALIWQYEPKGYKALFTITNINFHFYERIKETNNNEQRKKS